MSKHVTHSHCRVLHDVNAMTVEELENEYGIEVLDDDTVWDAFEYRTFKDVHAWAEFINLRDKEEAEIDQEVDQHGRIRSNKQRVVSEY